MPEDRPLLPEFRRAVGRAPNEEATSREPLLSNRSTAEQTAASGISLDQFADDWRGLHTPAWCPPGRDCERPQRQSLLQRSQLLVQCLCQRSTLAGVT